MTSSTNPDRPFGSVSVAMVTPFHDDGSIDIDSAQVLATKLVNDGCDALVLFGTTGEAPTTHQPEKDDVVRAVIDAVGDQATIVVGAGSNDTAHAVRMAQGAQREGADGLLVVAPYYNRPSQEGIYQHIRAVANSSDLPVMVYDIPGRTGVTINSDTMSRLAELDQIVAVKDATGDVAAGFRKMRSTGLAYYSGDDSLNYSWLTHGAAGVISVAGHVIAHRLRILVDAIDAGDFVAAREEFAEQLPIIDAMMGSGQGAVMAKEALKLLGVIPSAALRLPLVGATDAQIQTIHAALAAQGLLS